jgi:hypothetical protein
LITTKDENPEAGRKRESPKKDEGRRTLKQGASGNHRP